MNLLLQIPIEFRILGCLVLGAAVGSLANLAIYRCAWKPRPISPWSPAPKRASRRTWVDRIPVFGWLSLWRESDLHGPRFWVRPLAIELLTGVGFAALYWWEIEAQGLMLQAVLPPNFLPASPLHTATTGGWQHLMLCGHFVLLFLMIVATFIDVDERYIPDQITLPGTLLGLAAAAIYPWFLPPGLIGFEFRGRAKPEGVVEFIHVASPADWPPLFSGGPPNYLALGVGLGCLWLWCFALLPRTWHGRHGFRQALRFFVAKIYRERFSWWVLRIGLAASLAIALVWWFGGAPWAGLLSSLVGMAAGACIVWAVRLVGQVVLKKEAMGFGDVTLMAMIGAFVGWQAAVVVFFIAPLAGLVIGLANFAIRRDQSIPYGPFLCIATVVTIVFWKPIWTYTAQRLAMLGGWLPAILVFCLVAMTVLLLLLQLVKRMLRIGQ